MRFVVAAVVELVRFWREYTYYFRAFLSFHPAAERAENPGPTAAVLGDELTSSSENLPADILSLTGVC